jgi:hypothetical protein
VNATPTPGLQELRDALETLVASDPVVIQIERRGRMQYVPFVWE